LGVAFADFVSPYFLASSVLAAILERERTGLGQEIDGSQLPAMISLLSAEWMYHAHTGQEPPRRANRDPNYAPHGVYPAAGEDAWVAIAVQGDGEFRAFAEAIEKLGLASDSRFATHAARKANEDELDAIVAGWTRGRDRWEAAAFLQSHGIAASPVESIADQLDRDPGLARHYQVVQQPSEPDIEITLDGEPIRFDGLEGRVTRAPALGEHNEYVFREVLGLSEDEFVEGVASGAIG
jgi:crotonobetainyl-CoA:carnitine CoA-transferase CaiB-like acyl-CoA transferase